MTPAGSLLLVDVAPDGLRLVPAAPLGRWAMRTLRETLRSADPDAPVTLDLTSAPVSDPAHVAAVLWTARQAADRGLPLEIVAGDMVSAELLAFSGVDARVRIDTGARRLAEDGPAAPAARRRIS